MLITINLIFQLPRWYFFADIFKLLDAESVKFMSDQIGIQKTNKQTKNKTNKQQQRS